MMRKVNLILNLLLPILLTAQISESFDDGNFNSNPSWTGHVDNFFVNNQSQLQSRAISTSVSWLTTPSGSMIDATWECDFRVNFTTSSSNYACFYIASDATTLFDNAHAYYIQVGGTNDEVSLYYQHGNKKTKIIDGIDKRTDGSPVVLSVKLTRDAAGNFTLFSKLASETGFITEGQVQHVGLTTSKFIGLVYSNTSTTGSAYFFDNIQVRGLAAIDQEKPLLQNITLVTPNALILNFNEPVNWQELTIHVNHGIGTPIELISGNFGKQAQLVFDKVFEKGVIYTVQIRNVLDEAGNIEPFVEQKLALSEIPQQGDIVINEILFNAAENGFEYIEIMNISDKVLDASEIYTTTRRTDGTLGTLAGISSSALLAPDSVVAFTLFPDSVRNYHQVPAFASIFRTERWNALNNEKSKLLICNLDKTIVFDEVEYNENWHHSLISDVKGVSLERINPFDLTQNSINWHSAATVVQYGTPGYQNSQYKSYNTNTEIEKLVWCEPEAFSPNNDGENDIVSICIDEKLAGYVANISIFSPTGIQVAELARSFLLGTNNRILWNGINLLNKLSETGIYVVFFEAIHPSTGHTVTSKLPLVISNR